MKRLIVLAALAFTSMASSAQVSNLLCTYKGTHVPIIINYNSNTATNMNGEVNPAKITDTYIEFIDGKSTRVSINRATGQMVLNNHNDKPLQCNETQPKI